MARIALEDAEVVLEFEKKSNVVEEGECSEKLRQLRIDLLLGEVGMQHWC